MMFLLKEMLRPSYIRFSWLANLKQDPEGCSLPRLPTDDNGGFLKFPRVVSYVSLWFRFPDFFYKRNCKKQLFHWFPNSSFTFFSKLEFPTVLSHFCFKVGNFFRQQTSGGEYTRVGPEKMVSSSNPNTVKPPPTQPHLQLQHLRIGSDTTKSRPRKKL